MREVVRQIQGLPAQHAFAVLKVVPRKGARFVAKTLKSAMANAEDLKEHKSEPDCQGSGGANSHHSAAVHPQSAWFGRADRQAQLPHQDCPL
jgi:hypothetical protein